MRTFLGVLASAAVLFLLLYFIPTTSNPRGDQAISGLPWQVEALPNGQSRVFDLVIGASTLADGRQRFGSDGDPAIVAAPGEIGSLEMYFTDVTAGAITGKLILTAELPDNVIAGMWQRAAKVEYMQSSTKKATPAEQDLATANGAAIRAITFIPSVNLDEAVVLQRFGRPNERLRTSETVEHFLYPERGLDVILDTNGKELLQYVAPSRFEALRKPLLTPPGQSHSP
jgi:hypothetical protein